MKNLMHFYQFELYEYAYFLISLKVGSAFVIFWLFVPYLSALYDRKLIYEPLIYIQYVDIFLLILILYIYRFPMAIF